MKKNILIFGAISGLIVSAMMAFTAISCYKTGSFEGNMVVGFAVMIAAFSFIFVAIKNYRDQYNDGAITFGKALSIGITISLIGSTMYVLCWLVIYYNFFPDYMDKFVEHSVAEIKTKGYTAAKMREEIADVTKFKDWYRSPILVVLLTYLEVLPIGLIISFISSLVLKREKFTKSPFTTA